jgi:hypothetical protein
MTKPKPLMQKSELTERVSHKYHADSRLLIGYLTRPVELKIEEAFVSLSGRGGHLIQRMESFSAEGLISFESGYTRVSGSFSQQHGWVTLATAVLERLNVFDVITADRIVAQVSTALSGYDSHEPSLTFLGTRFENLRISGYSVDMELDLGVCGVKPEGGKRYLEDLGFLDRVQRQLKSVAGAKGIPEDLERQYDSNFASIDHLRKRAAGRAKGERHPQSKLQCSLVKSTGPIPILGVKTFGNVILIPDFGTVSLAEVEVGQSWREELDLTYFGLTMLNIRMGSIGEGTVKAAHTTLDGGARPPGGGSEGARDLGKKETIAVPPEFVQEYAAVSSPGPAHRTGKYEAGVLVPPTEAQIEVAEHRHINAWIVDGEPPLEKGRTYKFAINVGKLCEHAIAAPKLPEFDWKDNHELDVWIVLSGNGIMVEPRQQKFTLPKHGDTDPIFFAITPAGYGSVLLRISLYFARELTLLQEFEVSIPVKESAQVA